jgi:hypothetical protein
MIGSTPEVILAQQNYILGTVASYRLSDAQEAATDAFCKNMLNLPLDWQAKVIKHVLKGFSPLYAMKMVRKEFVEFGLGIYVKATLVEDVAELAETLNATLAEALSTEDACTVAVKVAGEHIFVLPPLFSDLNAAQQGALIDLFAGVEGGKAVSKLVYLAGGAGSLKKISKATSTDELEELLAAWKASCGKSAKLEAELVDFALLVGLGGADADAKAARAWIHKADAAMLAKLKERAMATTGMNITSSDFDKRVRKLRAYYLASLREAALLDVVLDRVDLLGLARAEAQDLVDRDAVRAHVARLVKARGLAGALAALEPLRPLLFRDRRLWSDDEVRAALRSTRAHFLGAEREAALVAFAVSVKFGGAKDDKAARDKLNSATAAELEPFKALAMAALAAGGIGISLGDFDTRMRKLRSIFKGSADEAALVAFAVSVKFGGAKDDKAARAALNRATAAELEPFKTLATSATAAGGLGISPAAFDTRMRTVGGGFKGSAQARAEAMAADEASGGAFKAFG